MSKQVTCCAYVLKTKETDKGTVKQALYQYLIEKGKFKQRGKTRELFQFYAVKKNMTLDTLKIDPFFYFYFSFRPSLPLRKDQILEFWGDFQLGEVFPQDEFFGNYGVVNESWLNNYDYNKFRHQSDVDTTNKKMVDCREEGQENEDEGKMRTRNKELNVIDVELTHIVIDTEEPMTAVIGEERAVHESCFNKDSPKGKSADKKILDSSEEGQEEDEDEDDTNMRTRKKGSSSLLKKWAFKYYAEYSAEDVWKDLKKVLEEHEKQNENRDVVQGAIINTKENHVYIEFTNFIDRSILEKVPSIVRTSIERWLTSKINIMTLSNGFFKENGYEAWPINRRREEPIPTIVGVEEQDPDSSLFSLLNDECSLQILLSLSTGKTIRNILDDCYEHSQLRVLEYLCGGLKNYFKKYETCAQSKLPK